VNETVTLTDEPMPDDGVPFEIGIGLYTDVPIDGRGPFSFVIDTGGSQNAIDPMLAWKLNLPLGEARQLRGAGGTGVLDARAAHFTSLAAGPYEQRDGSLITADIFEPLRAAMKRDFAGILG